MVTHCVHSDDETSIFVYAGATAPAYMVRGESTYRIVADNQGSVRLVVDAATGVVAQRLDYDSFGRVIRDTNPGFQPFGFQGGLYDPDTGLVEFGCRWYDAQTGRWISKDPILLDGGWNVYAFCDNDPVNRTDPSGLCENERGGISDKFIVTPSGYRIQYPANVDIMKNIEMAKSSWSPFWFRNQVKNKGPWDFKRGLRRRSGRSKNDKRGYTVFR